MHEFAARILAVIRADCEYRFEPNEDKNASFVCRRLVSDCAGMVYLFCAAMRANGVPARALLGRKAEPREEGSTPADIGYDQLHVRAEFFMPGVGWVPVDPSYAQAAKDEPVESFIGADSGDLLVLHVDPDPKLPFPDRNEVAKGLQFTPQYRVVGEGPFDGRFGPTGWDLTTAPIHK